MSLLTNTRQSFKNIRSSGFLLTCALLLLPPLFWAGNFIIGRAVRDEIPPVTLSLYRWIIASLVLLPFAWKALQRDRQLYWQHRWLILGISLTGITAFNSLIYLGLQSTQAANGIILNSFIPLLIVLLGGLFFGYSVGRLQIVGMVVSFAGVLAIVMRGDTQILASLNFAHGDLILLVAMVVWALYTIGLKAVPAGINRTGLLQVQMATGLVFLLPFWGWELASGQTPVWNMHSVLSLAYVGIVPSVLAYLLYNACVARLGPARAGLSIHLMPLFGAGLSVVYLGEQIHLYHIIGAILIFGGILLASRQRS
ncbi:MULTISPECIES: DMT family transporter [unclassified Thalassolituus]|uniref:DMT family transporter n=1 Tax=unclassified Thalassolituus TaxID=2624967 RepID=UPI0025F492DF|nr:MULTISPECIES: DMT family transporter [unclassified Thalassolituus]